MVERFEVGKFYVYNGSVNVPSKCLYVTKGGRALMERVLDGVEFLTTFDPHEYLEYREPKKLTIYVWEYTNGELFVTRSPAGCDWSQHRDTIEWVEKT